MPIVKIEKWGDSYRLVELFTTFGNDFTPKEGKKESKHEEDLHYMEEFFKPVNAEETEKAARFLSSIYRARSRVKELALCQKWEYFATFTLAEEKQDRFDIKQYVRDLGNWIGNYRKKYNCNLQYLIIPEQHKNGAWHAHGLLRNVAKDSLTINEHGYLDMPYYRNRFGYISLSKVKSHEKCATYITKYIAKDTESTSRALDKGSHLFYSSRGLQGKETLWVVSTHEHIQGGFRNEFGIFKWTGWNEVEKLIKADCRNREGILYHLSRASALPDENGQSRDSEGGRDSARAGSKRRAP